MKRFLSGLLATLYFVSVAQAQSFLLLGAGGSGIPGWVPSKFNTADLYVSATNLNSNGSYCTGWFRKTGQVKPCSQFLTRTGTGGTAFDASGNDVSFTGTALRATNVGLTSEETRTNSATNNSMTGAVAGTPGTNPTGWTLPANLSTQVVGIGTVNGLPYVDLRFFGTPTVTSAQIVSTGAVSGTVGQVWTNSIYISLVGGSLTNVTGFLLRAGSETGTTSFTPNATLTRLVNTQTLAATTATLMLRWNYVNTTTPVDFTLRIAGNQTELGSFATTPILTTNVAVTRAQDFISFSDVSWLSQGQGTLYLGWKPEGYNQGATSTLASIDDGTNANRELIYTTTAGVPHGFFASGGSSADIAGGAAITLGTTAKVAAAFATNDQGFAVNGTAATRGTTTLGVPSLTQARIGVNPDGLGPSSGTLTELAYFSSSLSNSQLQGLTQ